MNKFHLYHYRKYSMVLPLLFLIGVSLSCKKYTTSKRVSKIIVVDSWRIESFFFEGASVTNSFSEQAFAFVDGGGVLIKGIYDPVGEWSVGLNSNPATLYLSNFLNEPMTSLNDDWTVESCDKKEISLSSGENSLTLKKIDN